jgi:hypothetical protein
MDLVQKVLTRMLLARSTSSAITVTVNATTQANLSFSAPSANACTVEVSEGQDLHFCCCVPGCR